MPAIKAIPNNTKKGNVFGSLILIVILGALAFAGVYFFLENKSKLVQLNPFRSKESGLGVEVVLGSESTGNLVTKEGGTLELETEAGGARLDLPQNAVLGATDIAMTEIADMDGIPEGASFVTGVHIDSSDEVLMEVGDLYVPLPDTISDGAQLAGFAYDGEGNGFHLYPVTIENQEAHFKVFHFSGYGVIQIDSPDFKMPEQSDVEKDVMDTISALTKFASWRQLLGAEDEMTKEQMNGLRDLLREWYTGGVKPKLEAAVKNDDLIMDGVTAYIRWLQMVQMLGLDGELENETAAGRKLLAQAIEAGRERSYKKCTEGKDATMTGRLLKLAQIAQGLGLDSSDGVDDEAMIDQARKCAHFELRVKSTMIDTDSSETAVYSGTIPLTTDDDFSLSGSGEFTMTNIQIPDTWSNLGSCSINPTTYTENVIVPTTQIQITEGETNIRIVWQLQEETPDVNVTCVSENFEGTYDAWVTEDGFLDLHFDEVISIPERLIAFDDWEIVNAGGVYAKKTYQRNKDDIKEDTTMELIHLPQ